MVNYCHMSWQRVFKTARHLGAPVIITDQAGDDPLIIMPLDAYENLVGTEAIKPVRKPNRRSAEPDERAESIFEIPFEDEMPIVRPKDLAEARQKEPIEPVEETEAKMGEDQGISLDERFYFEPLEDEVKK
ncbi:MAG: hypothetical protein ACYC44_01905 [Patescibacteria group bacterium]